jgi:hypothetical protein
VPRMAHLRAREAGLHNATRGVCRPVRARERLAGNYAVFAFRFGLRSMGLQQRVQTGFLLPTYTVNERLHVGHA